MGVRITTLIENSLGENKGLFAEHGLSFFVEIGDPPQTSLLFDTGASGHFMQNAKRLNVDLSKVDQVIISHGHWDHSGGFKDFVEAYGGGFPLLVGEGFFTPKFSCSNGKRRYLGNDFDQDYLQEKGIKARYVTEQRLEIAPGAHLVTDFPRLTDFEKPNPRFCIFDGADYRLDLFDDEVVLVLEVQAGLVVLLGCSHPGVVNILQAIQARFDRPLHCVVGGTHLMEADDQRLNETLEYLRDQDFPLLGISHCTGDTAVTRLPETGKEVFPNCTGTILEFD